MLCRDPANRDQPGLVAAIGRALGPLAERVVLALVYGSVAKGTDTADGDIDLLIVADGVTLEEVYSALAAVESTLDRKINPALYTSSEFEARKVSANTFVARVLTGKHLVLIERQDGRSAAR